MNWVSTTQWKPSSVVICGPLRHDAEHARVDVPAAGGDDHVARAVAEFLHRAAGVARVVLDVLAELLQVLPGLVPALHRVLRVLVLQDVGKAHQEGPAGAGIDRACVEELVWLLPRPVEQLLRPSSAACRRARARIAGSVRTASRRPPCPVRGPSADACAARRRDRSPPVSAARRRARAGARSTALLDAVRQRAGPGQHQIDVDAVCGLHRFQLRGQLGRGRAREGDARDEIGVLVAEALDAFLRELQLAGDVDDVEHDRALGKSLRRRTEDGRAGHAGQQASASCHHLAHAFPRECL